MAGKAPSKLKTEKSHGAKPYERPRQSLLHKVASTFRELLVPSWLLNNPLSNVKDSEMQNIDQRESLSELRQSSDPSNIPAKRSRYSGIDGEEQNENKTNNWFINPSASIRESEQCQTSEISRPDQNFDYKKKLIQQPLINGDDQSENSEGSASTSGCSSLISSHQEVRDPQKLKRPSGLHISEESLERIRNELTNKEKSAKRLKKDAAVETDNAQNFSRSSISQNRSSLWSENIEETLKRTSRPQPISQGKKPSFVISSFGAPSVQSDNSFTREKNFESPFYQGNTSFGGAASVRRNQAFVPYQIQKPPQTQIHRQESSSSESSDCMSSTAKRILQSLEKMSTPLMDARKIPSSEKSFATEFPLTFTPASVRHKTVSSLNKKEVLKFGTPPISCLSTPSPVIVSKLSEFKSVPTTSSTSTSYSDSSNHSPVKKMCTEDLNKTASKLEKELDISTAESIFTVLKITTSDKQLEFQIMGKQGTSLENKTFILCLNLGSLYPKEAPVATVKGDIPAHPMIQSNGIIHHPILKEHWSCFLSITTIVHTIISTLSEGTNTTDMSGDSSTKKSLVEIDLSENDSIAKAGGKMRIKKSSALHISSKIKDKDMEIIEDPKLPEVSLTISSLPKFSFQVLSNKKSENKIEATLPLAGNDDFKSHKNPTFVFRPPTEHVTPQSLPMSKSDYQPTLFTFSSPAPVSHAMDSSNVVPNLFVPSPRMALKAIQNKFSDSNSKNGLNTQFTSSSEKSVNELSVGGSVMDVLRSSQSSKDNSVKQPVLVDITSSNDNMNSAKNDSSHLKDTSSKEFHDKAPSGSWKCSSCWIMNKENLDKCEACQTPRITLPSFSSGFGDSFKPAAGSWECSVCMIRNKESQLKCIACESVKPGTGHSNLATIVSDKFASSSELFKPPDNALNSKSEMIPTTSSFGEKYKLSSNKWECDTCLVRNSMDVTKCIACDTPKSSIANTDVKETFSGFKFNESPKNTKASSIFGSSAVKSGSSAGFKFGFSAAESRTNEGFKLQFVSNSNQSTEGFPTKLFSSEVQSTLNSKSSAQPSGFKFGSSATPSDPVISSSSTALTTVPLSFESKVTESVAKSTENSFNVTGHGSQKLITSSSNAANFASNFKFGTSKADSSNNNSPFGNKSDVTQTTQANTGFKVCASEAGSLSSITDNSNEVCTSVSKTVTPVSNFTFGVAPSTVSSAFTPTSMVTAASNSNSPVSKFAFGVPPSTVSLAAFTSTVTPVSDTDSSKLQTFQSVVIPSTNTSDLKSLDRPSTDDKIPQNSGFQFANLTKSDNSQSKEFVFKKPDEKNNTIKFGPVMTTPFSFGVGTTATFGSANKSTTTSAFGTFGSSNSGIFGNNPIVESSSFGASTVPTFGCANTSTTTSAFGSFGTSSVSSPIFGAANAATPNIFGSSNIPTPSHEGSLILSPNTSLPLSTSTSTSSANLLSIKNSVPTSSTTSTPSAISNMPHSAVFKTPVASESGSTGSTINPFQFGASSAPNFAFGTGKLMMPPAATTTSSPSLLDASYMKTPSNVLSPTTESDSALGVNVFSSSKFNLTNRNKETLITSPAPSATTSSSVFGSTNVTTPSGGFVFGTAGASPFGSTFRSASTSNKTMTTSGFGNFGAQPTNTVPSSFTFGSAATVTPVATGFSAPNPAEIVGQTGFSQFGQTSTMNFGQSAQSQQKLDTTSNFAFGTQAQPKLDSTSNFTFGTPNVFKFGDAQVQKTEAQTQNNSSNFNLSFPSPGTPNNTFAVNFNPAAPPSFNFSGTSTPAGPFQFQANSDGITTPLGARKIRKAIRRAPRKE